MDETTITISGTLVDRPDLRYTASRARAQFRVAVGERRHATAAAEDNIGWHTVIAWDDLAEHAADSLAKGSRVIVRGRLAERFENDNISAPRAIWEITADDLGLSLRHGPIPGQGMNPAGWPDRSVDLALRLG